MKFMDKYKVMEKFRSNFVMKLKGIEKYGKGKNKIDLHFLESLYLFASDAFAIDSLLPT